MKQITCKYFKLICLFFKKEICNGKGKCVCGKCVCDPNSGYFGLQCEDCPVSYLINLTLDSISSKFIYFLKTKIDLSIAVRKKQRLCSMQSIWHRQTKTLERLRRMWQWFSDGTSFKDKHWFFACKVKYIHFSKEI